MNIVNVFFNAVLSLSCCLLPPACSELRDICCNDTAEDDGICLTFVQVYYTATLIPETLTIERTASLLPVLGLWHLLYNSQRHAKERKMDCFVIFL